MISQPATGPSTPADHVRFVIGMVTVLCCVLAVMAAREKLLGDPDISWHIKTGSWIWQHQAFPTVDPLFLQFRGPALDREGMAIADRVFCGLCPRGLECRRLHRPGGDRCFRRAALLIRFRLAQAKPRCCGGSCLHSSREHVHHRTAASAELAASGDLDRSAL